MNEREIQIHWDLYLQRISEMQESNNQKALRGELRDEFNIKLDDLKITSKRYKDVKNGREVFFEIMRNR